MARPITKPAPTLRKYKLLCAQPTNGHFEVERYFVAANDDAAIVLAEEWRDHRGAELWRTYKVIKRWQ